MSIGVMKARLKTKTEESTRLTDNELYKKMFILFKSIKRELKTRPVYDCRCDERLEPKYDELKFLTYMGCSRIFLEATHGYFYFYFYYYESTKRKIKTKYVCGCRCYERLQPNTRNLHVSHTLSWSWNWNT